MRARGTRFVVLLILFLCSIGVLIFVLRGFGLMLGRDGLGVTPFLLVIYYNNRECMASGIITLLRNRVGDAFLLLFLSFGLVHFSCNFWDGILGRVTWGLALLVIIGGITKRV